VPKELFIPKNFAATSLALITKANEIIAEYQAQGFTLTLRQLYYQMVARDVIPNTVQSYKRLGAILNDARYAGMVDWSALEDRTRNLYSQSHWNSPGDIIRSAAYSFRKDKWEGQDYRPEIWVEKEALAGVVARAAEMNDCGYLSCRGYMSASEMYEAYQRIKRRRDIDGQETVIIYLGDHDPSGLDMSEGDIPKRFQIFMSKHGHDSVEVNRVALNWEQVRIYNPPPNPAKETDSRFGGYQQQYGDESWELDALDPNTLLEIIQGAVDEIKDDSAYDAIAEDEERDRELLTRAANQWTEIIKTLKGDNNNGKQ
jgi:hypothetical protein